MTESLHEELRRRGTAALEAVETLGKTHVFRSTSEYIPLLERARVWDSAMLLASNLVAHRYEPEELEKYRLPEERGDA